MQDPKQNLHHRDEATKNKIDRHLSDESDTISEQDIRNIDTDIHKSNSDLTQDLPADSAENDNEDEPKKDVPTVWEVED